MNDYSLQLARLRFWNRAAIAALLLSLPATFLVGVLINGTPLVRIVAPGTFAAFALVLAVAYVRIRTFPCPRCGKYFTVKHVLGTNSLGRRCVHCGLEAYSGA
jgi:hypothetical protein